jgi:hypothetical protein
MAAQYSVDFARKGDGAYAGAYVFSADARSIKAKDVRLAYRKAVAKAKDKLAKQGLDPREYVVTDCRCVG